MTKGFSLGDFTINQQATDQSAPKGFNLQDYNQNKLPPNTEQIKENPNINNKPIILDHPLPFNDKNTSFDFYV